METEKKFFNYPRAVIERRKLVRQLRRMHMQSEGYVLSSLPDDGELFTDLAALEQELAWVETRPRVQRDEMLQVA